jgi:hypothetical protein
MLSSARAPLNSVLNRSLTAVRRGAVSIRRLLISHSRYSIDLYLRI